MSARGRFAEGCEWLGAACSIHRAEAVDAIGGFNEPTQDRAAVIAAALGLPFHPAAVIRHAAETFRLQQRSREIVALLGGFAKQWGAFTEHMDRVGRRVDALQKDYDAMAGVRRRQLERQLDRVEDVRRRDRIPAVEVLAGGELELEEA